MRPSRNFVLMIIVTVLSVACATQTSPTAPSVGADHSGALASADTGAVIASRVIGAPQLALPLGCSAAIAFGSGASASPNTLWSPNHKWNDVTVSYTATPAVNGPCTASAPVCMLTVSSNEPVNGLGDGNTTPDAIVVDTHHVRLRAERSGTGDGRIYTIGITCTATVTSTLNAADSGTITGTTSTQVTVAHDQGKS
jgi:hypothetical protein